MKWHVALPAEMNKKYCLLSRLGLYNFIQEDGSLTLDLGPFTVALEFATGKTATVCGKPSADFFGAAFRDMALTPESVVMVGDDINSDVGGAQAAGMMGVLVRTGKFRPENEAHPTVKPDLIVDRLECFVDLVAGNKWKDQNLMLKNVLLL